VPTKSRGADGAPFGGGTLQSQVVGGVASVTFGHPKGNSLPGALLRELARSISTAGEDPEVRVIVLRSRGPGPFCAGASFDELVSIRDRATGTAFFSGFAQVILAMVRAPKLVVTRVHGKVVGGGVGIVAASDLVCAVRSAAARLSELSVGIGPFVVAPCIERKMGAGAFSAMTVDTEWRDADWCERHGLFSRLYPDPEALDTGVQEIVERLAASNPEAMARLKAVFWAGTEGWEALMRERAEISGELVLSDFTRAAIEGFKSR
jgi:methylglutaconyl-CoA hydratase